NNKVADTKDFNVFKYRNFYNGGGVAIGDVNNDGKPDIFFTSNQGSNKLYIYVCNSGSINGDDRANELYINQKDGTFKEMAHEYGLDDKGLSTQAIFFDYDHDADLDCFILNN